MINIPEELLARVEKFVLEWNSRVSDVPLLQIDGSWPGIGVLDLLTLHLRKKQPFSSEDNELIRSVAAYLAVYAVELWQRVRVQGEIKLASKGIQLRAIEGPGIDTAKPYIVDLEEVLRHLLQEFPSPFPVLNGFRRNLSINQEMVPLFMLGVITGLSPFNSGSWSDKDVGSQQELIIDLMRVLGQQCVMFYERTSPQELVGQVGELYLSNLLFPPMLMADRFPLEATANGLVTAVRELKLPRSGVEAFGRQIALAPLEQLSLLGLAICGASGIGPSPSIFGAAESRGLFVGATRASMLQLKLDLFTSDEKQVRDWLVDERFVEGDLLDFERERNLGFLPWIYMQPSMLKEKREEPRIVQLLNLLAIFDYAGALDLAEKIVADSPRRAEVRLQRIYMEILGGRFDAVERLVKNALTEPELEHEARLYALWGMALLSLGKHDVALQRIEQAFRMTVANGPDFCGIAYGYGAALAINGRYEEALSPIEDGIRKAPSPLTGMLNRAVILQQLGRSAECAKTLTECLKITPWNQRLFLLSFPM